MFIQSTSTSVSISLTTTHTYILIEIKQKQFLGHFLSILSSISFSTFILILNHFTSFDIFRSSTHTKLSEKNFFYSDLKSHLRQMREWLLKWKFLLHCWLNGWKGGGEITIIIKKEIFYLLMIELSPQQKFL